MNFLWLVGLVCLSAGAARSQNDVYPGVRDNHRRKFCGKTLADTLSLVCRGRYYEYLNTSKKDVQFGDFSNDDYMDEQGSEEPGWPFLSSKSAASLVNSRGGYMHRRFRRGVHDECCKKSCSISEMRSYCGA